MGIEDCSRNSVDPNDLYFGYGLRSGRVKNYIPYRDKWKSKLFIEI